MSEQLMRELNPVCLSRCSRAKTGTDWAAFLDPGDLVPACKRLLKEEYHLEDVTVVDTSDGFVAVYHFARFVRSERITLRVLIPHDNPKIPTISGVYHGANWHERETTDFYGIDFTGHPNLIPLLLPEDADFHPLVKDDKTRVPARTVLEAGEILVCAPGFTLFDEEEAAEEEAEKAE